MILETLSDSIAGVTALGLPEWVAAGVAFLVYVSALSGIQWLGRVRPETARDDAREDFRDAA